LGSSSQNMGSMKANKLTFAILIAVFMLVGCESATIIAPTETASPSQTSTPSPPTITPTPTIIWTLATPLKLSYGNSDELISVLDQNHPYPCLGENRLYANPTPIEPGAQVSSLKFTEIDAFPKPEPRYGNIWADNIDKSRTAFTGCQPRNCGKLYVKNNITGKVYKIDFGATTDRPLDWLQWITKDSVTVTQQGHLWITVVVINVEKQEYEYYGMFPGCPDTPTPTP
jgi:hypothetical protein